MFTLFLSFALAAPPSSHLSGPDGDLTWSVREEGDQVHISGQSPRWTVQHTAHADLRPVHTVHTDPSGVTVTIDYTEAGATVNRDGATRTFATRGLWDGDTVDVRLGALVASGRTDNAFKVVDPMDAKVYSLDSAKVAEGTCGTAPCTEVRVQLTGLLRYVGPTWRYWYGADGQLLRFEGPAGSFEADGGAP